jgi:hypothetical protein
MKLSIPLEFKSAVKFGDWTLYHLPLAPTGSFLWQRFKLMLPPDAAPARRGQTRAYRLTWSPLEQRFAKDGPSTRLERVAPVLYDMVEFHMAQTYGPDWLTERALYEPEEIEAERERLRAGKRARAAEARAAGRE